jgi:hypothetical protein
MADIHLQQPGFPHDGGPAAREAKPALSSTALIAERITTAILLIICIAAAALI